MIWKAVEKFGYDHYLISMIRTLYMDASSAVMNNGHKLDAFLFERSCRQGDCVSPYLFLLAIEPLLNKLRQKLPGVDICGVTCKLFGLGQ